MERKHEKMCIPKGNDFTLVVKLERKMASPSGDTIMLDVAEMATEVTLITPDDKRMEVPKAAAGMDAHDLQWAVADVPGGKAVAVTVPCDVQRLGGYGLEVVGAYADGSHWRYKAKAGEAFKIVDATSDQNVPDGQVMVYAIHGTVGIGVLAGGGGIVGAATESWVTEHFQPKGDYLTKEDVFANSLREMMAIEVNAPHDHHSARIPIILADQDFQTYLLAEGDGYKPLAFTVTRTGASWQEVEDAVAALGYELLRHEVVLLRRMKRKVHFRTVNEDSPDEYVYTRKLKRGYVPYLTDMYNAVTPAISPFDGKDFTANDTAEMLLTDFLKWDGMDEDCPFVTEALPESFIIVEQDTRDYSRYSYCKLNVKLRGCGIAKGDITIIGGGTEKSIAGQQHIDCAIAEMVEVRGHRRFYGNVVYGRLFLAANYNENEDVALVSLSFVPRLSVANDILPHP